jgi:hypothetical protein
MNLQELHESKKTKLVKRALREHYELNIDFDRLSLPQTQKMISKVRGLLKETRSKASSHQAQTSGAYLKLVMMEQALVDHLQDLRTYRPQIVTENEEVQKSQVILAAQDMIDSVQKMLEQVSKMNVEELTAVVDGMKNEFGTAEGDKFNQSVSEALSALQAAITTAKGQLSSALGSVTGESTGSMDAGMGMPQAPGQDDMAADMGMNMGDEIAASMDDEMAPEESPPEDLASAGRERR